MVEDNLPYRYSIIYLTNFLMKISREFGLIFLYYYYK